MKSKAISKNFIAIIVIFAVLLCSGIALLSFNNTKSSHVFATQIG